MVGYSSGLLYVLGVPTQYYGGNFTIDVDHNSSSVVSLDNTRSDELGFMLASGSMASSLEHVVMEQVFQLPGVSAVKVMEEARSRNIPILDITIDNYAEMNSILSAPASVRLDIFQLINENTVISIPSRQIDYYGWFGTGYIVSDTETCGNAYRLCGSLSDSMSGGATAIKVGIGALAALDIVLCVMDLMILLQVMMPASGLVSFAAVSLPAVTAIVLLTLGCMSLTYSLVNYYHYLDTGDEQYAYNMLFNLIPNVLVFSVVKFLANFGPFPATIFSRVSGFLDQGANSLILKYGDEFAQLVAKRGSAAIDYINGCDISVINTVKGFGNDGINALLKYKGDLIAIIGSFSDNADDVVGFVIKFGDEAVDAMMNGISPALINSLDELGIAPIDYVKYNIVSKEIAEMVEGTESIIKNGLRNISVTRNVCISAEEVNAWWSARGYTNPYKVNTIIHEITLTENTQFVRVIPEGADMVGGWVMKFEDIQGLTAQQIQNKFALPSTPVYVCDVELEAGSIIRCGITGPQEQFGGSGGGLQFDLMQQWIGDFTNKRLLP